MCYTTQKGVEDKNMNQKEQVKKYLEYCEFRKELDWNTLKAYRIYMHMRIKEIKKHTDTG